MSKVVKKVSFIVMKRLKGFKLKLSVSVWPVLFLSLLVTGPVSAALEDSPVLQDFNQLQHAGLLVLDAEQVPVYAKNAKQSFIPASTTKLITALLALQYWGEDYQFKTEFYLTYRGGEKFKTTVPTLLIKGFGDPFLVSEELALIAKQLAKQLKQQNIQKLSGIILDTSYYQGGVRFSGAGHSDNPYDAVSSALAANFNTVYLQQTEQGIISAESQTPITPAALMLAEESNLFSETIKSMKGGKKRVNLGRDEALGQRYFAELLRAFLKQEGVAVSNDVAWQTLEEAFEPILLYQHRNQRTLAEVVTPMMKYSTNFIANQLALNLSREWLGAPANAERVAKVYQQRLVKLFDWQQFTIEEGAGLSRQNRLSPQQLIDVLEAFQPWRHLLPEIEPNVYAKSGTLLGVSTLAGYLYKEEQWFPFALMINQAVPFRYRNQLVRVLAAK